MNCTDMVDVLLNRLPGKRNSNYNILCGQWLPLGTYFYWKSRHQGHFIDSVRAENPQQGPLEKIGFNMSSSVFFVAFTRKKVFAKYLRVC